MDLRCFRWSLIFLTFSRSQQVYPLPDPMTDKGPQPVNVRPYRYSLKKDEDEKIVREMLSLGIKKPSCSLFSFLVVLVGKKDTWHMCTHYRALNKMTVKDKFHIPVTDELLDEHHGANVSSKLHLPSGYQQMRVHPSDVTRLYLEHTRDHYDSWSCHSD